MSRHKLRRDPRAPLRRTPLVLLSDALVLLCALTGAVFSFTTAFALDVLPLPLLAACLVSGALFLAVFSLPRARHCLAALGVLLPLAGVAVWRLWEPLCLGEISVRCALVNRFAQDFSFLSKIYPIAQLPDAVWRASGTLWLGALAALLALGLGWAVCRVRSFWLVFWLTFPLLIPPLCITVTPGWLPLMTLLACWCALLLSSLAARRDPAGGARLTLMALPAAGALLLLLTAALPREGYRQPRWAQRAQVALVDWGSDLGRRLSLSGGLLPGPFSGFTAAGGAESVDLSAAGPLRYSGRAMLRVQTEVRGKLYLRGYSAGVFTGTGWEPLDRDTRDGFFPEDGGPMRGYEPLNLPALTDPDSAYHPVTIEVLGAPGGCLYTPYQLVTNPEQVRGAQFENDSYLARDRSVRRHTVYFKPEALAHGTFTPLGGDAARAERAYRDFVYENYLGVPQEAEAALDRWLGAAQSDLWSDLPEQDLSGVPDALLYIFSTQQAIQFYLDHTTQYDPQTPLTPAGKYFLDYFLNESGRGYCMHYATAATLIFRMCGIPARYVSGYVTSVPASGRVTVPDSSAHAWTEVYVDGYGWYPVDLTPGYEGGALPWAQESAEPTPTPSAVPSAVPAPSADPSAAPTPSAAPETQAPGGAEAGGPLWWGLLPAVLALFWGGLVLRRALARRARDKRMAVADPNRAAAAAYAYLLRLAPWGVQCPEEIGALAQKAAFSQHTLTDGERDAVIACARVQAERLDGGLPLPRRILYRYFYVLY